MDELDANQLESQALLEPLTIEFSLEETELLREHANQLQVLGFDLEEFGGRSFRLRTIPSIFTGKDPEEAIRAVVEDFEEDETPLASRREALLAARICKRLAIKSGQLRREALLAARICKRLAIKSGQLLSLEEQRELIRALEGCSAPRTCPHGRPTMIHLPVATLARQFGRA
jgi:DNA mismatch repair protein MutL